MFQNPNQQQRNSSNFGAFATSTWNFWICCPQLPASLARKQALNPSFQPPPSRFWLLIPILPLSPPHCPLCQPWCRLYTMPGPFWQPFCHFCQSLCRLCQPFCPLCQSLCRLCQPLCPRIVFALTGHSHNKSRQPTRQIAIHFENWSSGKDKTRPTSRKIGFEVMNGQNNPCIRNIYQKQNTFKVYETWGFVE